MTRFFSVVFLLMYGLCQPPASAQKLDPHNLLLFSMNRSATQVWSISDPHFLSAFNMGGYNNQPYFINDAELYLSVQRPSDTTQTDLYGLQLNTQILTQVTATPYMAEYSPQRKPNGRQFSAVRVEREGVQRLWVFPFDRSNQGSAVFPEMNNVGYHCWLSDSMAALFLVGTPNTLVMARMNGQRPARIAADPGRCLQRLKDGRLALCAKSNGANMVFEAVRSGQRIFRNCYYHAFRIRGFCGAARW
ncbi:MAG: hypothetical protein IPL65_01335 [Lewinellaceae bacterium]|nr:hypothetical protein [Lewinellaceae bacterium]